MLLHYADMLHNDQHQLPTSAEDKEKHTQVYVMTWPQQQKSSMQLAHKTGRDSGAGGKQAALLGEGRGDERGEPVLRRYQR